MDIQKKARILIDEIIKATDLTQEEISVRAGYKEQTLTQSLSRGDISTRMINAIEKEFKDALNKSIVNNNINFDEPVKTQYHTTLTSKDIQDILDCNRVLADTNKILAENQRLTLESNKNISASNIELSRAASQKNESVTIDAFKELKGMLNVAINNANSNNQPHISEVLEPYLHLIAGALAGKSWKDENAGMKELRKILTGQIKGDKVLGK